MANIDEIKKVILRETSSNPSCGLGIQLPDDLDGYYFWQGWDRVKRPYSRDKDDFALALDELVDDGVLIRADRQLYLYVNPTAHVDTENDVFAAEIDYLIYGDGGERDPAHAYSPRSATGA